MNISRISEAKKTENEVSFHISDVDNFKDRFSAKTSNWPINKRSKPYSEGKSILIKTPNPTT